jgi:hypothetical protein
MSPDNDKLNDENTNNNLIINNDESISKEKSTIIEKLEKEEKTLVYDGIEEANNVILNFVNNTKINSMHV